MRLVFLLALLALPLAGCPKEPDDFPRGDGDDDDGHGGPEDGQSVAWFDLKRTEPFGGGTARYSTAVSFFAPLRIDPPEPADLDACISGSAASDPWGIPASDEGFGVPIVTLDGDEWEIEMLGTPYFTRELPERTWSPGAQVGLFVPGGASADATTWLDILTVPTNLVGGTMTLSEDGIALTWTAGNADDRLRLILSSVGLPRSEYVTCLVADDGEFLLKGEDLAEYPARDVTLVLQRERDAGNSDWEVTPGAFGRTLGASRLKADFNIPEGLFEDAGDDDDDSN